MAAFSRGRTLLPGPYFLRPQSCVKCIHQNQQLRCFTASIHRPYASNAPSKARTKKTLPLQTKTPLEKTQRTPLAPSKLLSKPEPIQLSNPHTLAPAVAKPTAPSPVQTGSSRVKNLAPSQINASTLNHLLTSPEPVYESPSFKLFTVSSYSLSSFFMLYGSYALSLWAAPPEGIDWRVTVAFGISASVLFGVGMWTLAATTGLVRRITAVPSKPQEKPLQLRLEVSSWVPWRTKSFDVPIAEATLSQGIHDASLSVSPNKYRAPLSSVNFMLRPWVWMGRGLLKFGVETRSVLLREHVTYLLVEGK